MILDLTHHTGSDGSRDVEHIRHAGYPVRMADEAINWVQHLDQPCRPTLTPLFAYQPGDLLPRLPGLSLELAMW